ncbi:DUF3281 family protein [Francisella hispaniensis]|uniref:Hypothetical lipoprotein n=1 Tax=Francisella hispaniensis TaxID=622488 RepID=F4BJR1_9GAMM|nr:DUF3281 family protein [Francisella hispaniensis]AEB28405.1 hypothetical lipoprotein [Francisella hispaniensis]
MKKTIIVISILVVALVLSSCSDNETTKELRIEKECNSDAHLCKFELVNAVVTRQTNFLGKTIERIQSKSTLQSIQGTIIWSAENGTLADNNLVEQEFNSGCQDGTCTENSNPTAFSFSAIGSHSVSVSGNLIIDGKSISLADTVQSVEVDTIDLPLATGDFVLIGVPQAIFNNVVIGDGVIITTGKDNSIGFTCPAGFTKGTRPTGTYDWVNRPAEYLPLTFENQTQSIISPAMARADFTDQEGYNTFVFMARPQRRVSNWFTWTSKSNQILYSCISDQITQIQS